MDFVVSCRCGREFSVTSTMAGCALPCDCGESLVVPSLRELRQNEGKVIQAEQLIEQAPVADEKVTVLLTPNFYSRVDATTLECFGHALGRTMEDFCNEQGAESCLLHCIVCVAPGKKLFVDSHVATSEGIDGTLGESLREKVEALLVPVVEHRPIGFMLRWPHGEAVPNDADFPRPFPAKLSEDFEGDWDQALELVAGYSTDSGSQSLASRLVGFFKSSPPKTHPPKTQELEAHPDEPLLPNTEFTVDDLNTLTQDHPDNPVIAGLRGRLAESQGRFDSALADYTRMISLGPHEERAWFIRAMCHCSSGNSAKGMADLAEAIRLNPTYATARLVRAQLLIQLGAYDEAKKELSTAIENNALRSDVRVLYARLSLREGKHEECIAQLSTVLDFAPYQMDALALKTQAERWTGAIDGAQLLEQLDTLAWLNGSVDPWILVERANILASLGDHDAVVDACDKAIEIDSTYWPAYSTRAAARIQRQEYDLALQDCERALDHDADDTADIYLMKSQIFSDKGDLSSAMDNVEAALQMEPSAAALVARAELHIRREDAELAIEDFEKAIELSPDIGYFHNRLAVAYALNKEPNKAIVEFDRSIELQPDAPFNYANRGLFWRDQNEPYRALEDLNKAVSLSTHDPGIRMERANLLASMNSPEEAVRQLDEILTQFPDIAEALSMRASLNSQLKDFERAESDFSRLISMDQNTPLGYANRAAMWLRKGEDQKANADYEEAIQQAPEYADAINQHRLLTEASLKHEQCEFDEAIRILSAAIDEFPDLVGAYNLRGASYWYAEKFVEAADDYSRCLELLGEESLSILNSRGQVYAELGEYDLALADLDRVIESDKKAGEAMLEAFALNGRGLAHSGLQNWNEAERDFLRSIELCAENAWTHYNHGLMYFHQKKMKEAGVCFELALSLNGPELTPRKRAKAKGFLEKCNPHSTDDA